MTRKDYIKLALVLKVTRPEVTTGYYEQWRLISDELKLVLIADSPKFSNKKWEDYING